MEELEDRLGDRMDEVLSYVKSSLTNTTSPIAANGAPPLQQTMNLTTGDRLGPLTYTDMDEEGYVGDEIMFDDTGEGLGVEGDLDVDDD